MTTRKKYIFTILSLLISISLAMPVCCHAMVETASGVQSLVVAQQAGTAQILATCSCGHRFRKDITKAQDSSSKSLQKVDLSGVFVDVFLARTADQWARVYNPTLFINRDSGPPLYLLNSAFLN